MPDLQDAAKLLLALGGVSPEVEGGLLPFLAEFGAVFREGWGGEGRESLDGNVLEHYYNMGGEEGKI